MSNQFPDPSQSPWTNPDTGVEFQYDVETGSWAPTKESTPGQGETLDSVSQRDPQTDINVTVGNTIGMDDSKDAFKGGPHELKAVGMSLGEIISEHSWLKHRVYPSWHGYSPDLNMHILAETYNSDTVGLRGRLGNLEEFTLPKHNGSTPRLGAIVWAEGSFYGFNGSRKQVWESEDGINWSVTDNVTNTYPSSSSDIHRKPTYNPFFGKIMWGSYDRNSSTYSIAHSNPGEHFAQEEINYPSALESTGGGLVLNAPVLLVTTSGLGDTIAMYSNDMGVSWQSVSSSANHNITSKISYVNGEYWSKIDCNSCAVSKDLVSWELRPSPLFNSTDWPYSKTPTEQVTVFPYNYDEGVYLSCQDTVDSCAIGYSGWSPVLFSRDGVNWGGVPGLGELFDYHYAGIFIDKDDNLVVLDEYGYGPYYLPNFTKDVVRIDRGGLYYDDELVATRENLDPIIDIINSHTGQIGNIDGKYMPLDINTLPPA